MGFWELNLQILTILAEHRTEFFNGFFSSITWLGTEYAMIAALAVLYLLYDKKLAYKLSFSFLIASVTVQVVKIICQIIFIITLLCLLL